MTALSPKIGAIIWIWIFSTFLETIAIANQEARVATAFIVASSFSKTLLMGAAVFAFGTVEAFMYAAMIQGVVQTFILLNYIRSRFPGFWRGFSVGFLREQLEFAKRLETRIELVPRLLHLGQRAVALEAQHVQRGVAFAP